MPVSHQGTTSRTAFVGVTLVVIGLGLWAIFRITWGSEQHSYARGLAPASVQVVKSHTYSLAVRGGVSAEQRLGVDPSGLSCSAMLPSGGLTQLTLTTESTDTKATNQIATFDAPVTGQIHVQCAGLAAVFVDNAAGAQADISGWWLLLATIALTVGIPLVLSVIRRAAERVE